MSKKEEMGDPHNIKYWERQDEAGGKILLLGCCWLPIGFYVLGVVGALIKWWVEGDVRDIQGAGILIGFPCALIIGNWMYDKLNSIFKK